MNRDLLLLSSLFAFNRGEVRDAATPRLINNREP